MKLSLRRKSPARALHARGIRSLIEHLPRTEASGVGERALSAHATHRRHDVSGGEPSGVVLLLLRSMINPPVGEDHREHLEVAIEESSQRKELENVRAEASDGPLLD